MHIHRRLQQVAAFLESCDGRQPVHRQLQDFFSAHRSMGARDRRELRSLVYSLFRLGGALKELPLTERMAVALLLTDRPSDAISDEMLATCGWDSSQLAQDPDRRLQIVRDRYPGFRFEDLFPLAEEISPRIDRQAFIRSMLVQPNVWIRIRDRHRDAVEKELLEKGFLWVPHGLLPSAVSFPAATPLMETASYQAGYFEIQDLSSQGIGAFLQPHPDENWWDACAASGGKSLMLLEQEAGIRLTATDIRASIIRNYTSRLEKAGFNGVKTQVVDLSHAKPFSESTFDAVMADVPCSGSGTWSRTPEMLTFFKKEDIQSHYRPLQQAILDTCVFSLKKGGKLIFSTCSVFSIENEDNTSYLTGKYGLRIHAESYISGVPDRADSMYVAVLIKD